MFEKSLFIGDQTEWSALDPEKDSSTLSAWSSDLSFSRHIFRKPARNYAAYEIKKKITEDLKEADDNRLQYFFAVRRKNSEDMIALLHFAGLHISLQAGRLYLHFASPEDLTQYGREVLSMALNFGFMELNLHRVTTELASYQEEQLQLFESCGFLREIQLREAAFHNGRYHDLLGYAILRPEYKKQYLEVAA